MLVEIVDITFIFLESLGTVLCLIVGVLLWWRKAGIKLTNALLGSLLILYGLTTVGYLFAVTNVYDTYPFLRFLPSDFSWSLAPLFYLFVKARLRPALQFQSNLHYSFHFVLPLLLFIFQMVVTILAFTDPSSEVESTIFFLSYIESMLFWLYNAFYLTITFLFIKKERQTDHWKEPVGHWLYRFAIWLTLFLSINFLHEFFYSSLVPFLQSSNGTTLWLFPVKFASVGINLLLVYQAFAYQYPSFYLQKTAAEHIRLSSQTKEQLENIRAQLDLRLDYYLLFKEANDTKLAQKIKELFEEKQMHLDPELTLATFTKMTGYAQEEVVQFFIEQNTTFATTLNQYRVVSFVEMAMQPTYAHVSILGIAYQAGFNAKATFHSAFKVLKGESPKAYLAYRKSLLAAK